MHPGAITTERPGGTIIIPALKALATKYQPRKPHIPEVIGGTNDRRDREVV